MTDQRNNNQNQGDQNKDRGRNPNMEQGGGTGEGQGFRRDNRGKEMRGQGERSNQGEKGQNVNREDEEDTL